VQKEEKVEVANDLPKEKLPHNDLMKRLKAAIQAASNSLSAAGCNMSLLSTGESSLLHFGTAQILNIWVA